MWVYNLIVVNVINIAVFLVIFRASSAFMTEAQAGNKSNYCGTIIPMYNHCSFLLNLTLNYQSIEANGDVANNTL